MQTRPVFRALTPAPRLAPIERARARLAAGLIAAALLAAIGAALPARAADDPLAEGTAAIARKDYPTAVRLLQPLATAGNAVAQVRLGTLYYHGHGVRESDAQALRWYEAAARQGLAEAQFLLGNMYAYGLASLPPEQDAQRLAATWYFEAARQGHADAQYSLGILFLTGSGVVPSAAEASKWIVRAAAQGHVDARAWLAGQQPAAAATTGGKP